MKATPAFFSGLIIGIISCYLAMRTKPVPSPALPAPEPVSQVRPSIVPPPIEQKMELHNSLKVTNTEVKKPPTNTQPAEQALELRKDLQPQRPLQRKSNLSISLSEEDVSALEQQWNDLPRQAEAILEARGWRIKRLQPDSLLATSGLQEGDLVTSASLQAYAQSQGNDQLAIRVANILNHISR